MESLLTWNKVKEFVLVQGHHLMSGYDHCIIFLLLPYLITYLGYRIPGIITLQAFTSHLTSVFAFYIGIKRSDEDWDLFEIRELNQLREDLDIGQNCFNVISISLSPSSILEFGHHVDSWNCPAEIIAFLKQPDPIFFLIFLEKKKKKEKEKG